MQPPGPTPSAPPSAWKVGGVFALGGLGISFAAIFVRLALPAPPVVTGLYRMLFASLLLAAVVALRRDGARAAPRDLALAALAGAFFGTDLALWHTGIVHTSVANATLLVNTTPIPVGLWTVLVLGERPGRRFVVGAALALAGTAVLLGADWHGDAGSLRGDALSLGAACFYAGYLILMKQVRRGVDALRGTLAAAVGATAVLAVYAVARGDPLTGFPASSWAAFVGAATVTHLGGVLGIIWALRWLRATFASVALLVQPVGTALLGFLLLGEPVGGLQALGGAVTLGGILLASRSGLDPDAAGRAPADRAPDGPPA